MIPLGLAAWAIRHQVTPLALQELAAQLGMFPDPPVFTGHDPRSEAYVQSNVRLTAPSRAEKLFRNNVGVLKDDTGRPVRYGLANDTHALNDEVKSGDLIGIRRVTILPEHVGQIIGQFVSYECKPEGWTYTGTDREVAQGKWAGFVVSQGGHARFTTGPGSL